MNDQNERFDDREIKMLYKENAQRTAPDMEKLWSRIESEIDRTDAAPQRSIVQTKKTTSNSKMIRTLISLAATFFVVFGITAVIARNSASPDKSSEKSFRSDSRVNAAEEEKNVDNGNTSGIAGSAANSESRSGGATKQAERSETKDEFGDRTAAADETQNAPTQEDNAADGDTVSSSDTGAQKSDQQISGSTGSASATEAEVLGRTEAFLDAKVVTTEQNGDACTYTLEVITAYQATAKTEGFTAQLRTDIPLGLTVGAEYLIPVYEDADGMHPAVYREPQIMFTDGSIVFPALWTTLAEDAEDLGSGMMAAPADRTEKLIEKWRNS